MAPPFAANMQQPVYLNAAHLSVDTEHAQAYFDDRTPHQADDGMFDHSAVDSGLELSPPVVGSRRESIMDGTPLFEAEDWSSADMQSVPSNNPFFRSTGNNPFMHLHQANDVSSFNDQWAFPNLDSAQGDFNANASVLRNMSAQTPMNHPGNMFATEVKREPLAMQSPTQNGLADSAQPADGGNRHPSPAIRSHRDGIRKKNARFDIPPERTLNNIDQLIAEAKTDKDIRDLKAQKRLLRNRQAALDSRQRKKQHTERLEDEKKQFTAIISEMEEEMNELRARMELLFRERQEYAECVTRLTAERDELIVNHTNETGDLRKKISVLTDHVRRLESDPTQAGAAQNPGGYGVYGQMDDLAVAAPWEHASFIHDYPAEPEQQHQHAQQTQQTQQTQQQLSLVPAKKNDSSLATAGDKGPQQGGMLFMLFLVGAFVLSSRSTPAIPRVSEDVRAASETLLDNVLRDAGVGHMQPSDTQALAPQPSGTWHNPNANVAMGAMEVEGIVPSALGDLGDRLTQPTRQQTNEQVFSLSAAQYNGMHSQDFIHNNAHERFNGQGRKTLADALSSMRVTEKQDSAAEVYTRSLLWDQIPSEVVQNFAKMVAECNNAQNEQQCSEPIS